MVTAVPSLEAVVDGIHTVLSAIGGIGTVLKGFHSLEDDVEAIEIGGYISSGSMDLWFIEVLPTEPFEGPATGEQYDRYRIRVRYWSIRTGNADWQKEARVKLQSAADTMTDHASIFAISGQQQLKTPTVVRVVEPEQKEIRGGEAGPQMVYEGFLELAAEARRWS